MPADDASPLQRNDGPAIQMDSADHLATSSHGAKGRASKVYRNQIKELLVDGKWRNAISKEILDIRRLSREIGNSKKYNKAIREMLAYFKCLEKNGLLK